MEDINNLDMHPNCWASEYGDMERDDLINWVWMIVFTDPPF